MSKVCIAVNNGINSEIMYDYESMGPVERMFYVFKVCGIPEWLAWEKLHEIEKTHKEGLEILEKIKTEEIIKRDEINKSSNNNELQGYDILIELIYDEYVTFKEISELLYMYGIYVNPEYIEKIFFTKNHEVYTSKIAMKIFNLFSRYDKDELMRKINVCKKQIKQELLFINYCRKIYQLSLKDLSRNTGIDTTTIALASRRGWISNKYISTLREFMYNFKDKYNTAFALVSNLK